MKRKTVSQLEEQVLQILWNEKVCSVKDTQLKLQTDHQVAYTTVATILQRLYEKGLVKRKSQGISYLYRPAVTKDIYSQTVTTDFLRQSLARFGDTAIVSFAESIEKLPKKKREYFLTLLNRYDKHK